MGKQSSQGIKTKGGIEMSYTKGKWKITEIHKGTATLSKECIKDVELPIATIEFHRSFEMNEANARLIASAPELLEACKAISKAKYGGDEYIEAMTLIDKAIVKAEKGE